MAAAKNLDPQVVRRAYLNHGANVRAAAQALGTSRETVYAALRAAPPLVVDRVNLPGLDPESPDSRAIAHYVRACLARAGILKEQP